MKIPKECYEQFGADLDGCSTQGNEGCGRCNLAKGNGMKIEEQAIETIQQQFKCIGIDYSENKDITAIAVAYGKEAEAVINALEKQIPKPPENKVHEKYKALGKNYYCTCGVMFVDFERNGTNYCGNCGQRLK